MHGEKAVKDRRPLLEEYDLERAPVPKRRQEGPQALLSCRSLPTPTQAGNPLNPDRGRSLSMFQ